MYRKGGFFRFVVVGFLLFMLFGAIRGGAYRSGFSQGYYAGQVEALTAQGDGVETAVPVNPYQRGPGHVHGHGFGFFGFFGGLFTFFIGLMLFGTLFKLMMFRRWRRGGFGGRHGRHHKHGWKGPRGPRGRHRRRGHRDSWHGDADDEPYEKSPEDVDPDIRTV